MRPGWAPSAAPRLSLWLLSLLAAGYLFGYVVLAVLRMRYPFELEWMEGGSVDHVRRVLGGEQLYVRPSVDFVPYIYTPLYFYVAAGVAKLVGVGFLALRLVSFVASVASIALIFLLVRKETGSNLVGLVSCGLFAACFRIGGAWFDIARVDSLALAFILLAAYLVRFAASWRHAAVAGVVAGLSVMTKQIGLLVVLALAVFMLRRSWRWAVAFSAAAGGLVVASSVVLQSASNGWYSFYAFRLAREHDVLGEQLWRFWSRDLLAPLGLAVAVAVFYLVSAARSRPGGDLIWFYLPFSAAMVGQSWVGRLHSGGYDNVLIPAYASLAVLFGLGANQVLTSATGPWRSPVVGLFTAAAALQFVLLAYDPRDQVPTAADKAAGREMLHTLRGIQGEVWMQGHGHYTSQVGKGRLSQSFAMLDVVRAEDSGGRALLLADVQRAIEQRRFSAVVLSSAPWAGVVPPDFERHYQPQRPVFRSADVFWPVTGARVRPETIWVPRPTAISPRGA